MKHILRWRLLLIACIGLFYAGNAQNPNCATISTFPYAADFDDVSWVAGSGSSNTGSVIDTCWTRNPTSGVFWGTRSGGTSSSPTGPSGAHNGSNYVYMESSPTGTVPATLNMPVFNLNSLTSPEMQFYYHMHGSNMGTLEIEASLDTGSTWTSVFTKVGQQTASSTSPWNMAIVNLTAYKSAHTLIRIKGTDGTGFYSDMAIDAISIGEAPACPQATNLAAVNVQAYQVTATWTSVSAASSYTIIYGATGFDPATAGSSTTSTVDSVVITGLSAAMDYDFYVIADCSTNGLSDTAGAAPFTTACAAIALPYSQNFDATATGGFTNPSLPNCWSYYSSANGYMYTYGFGANSAPNSLYIYNSSFNPGTDTLLAISPELIGLDSADKQVTFWSKDGSTFSQESIVFGTMGDPTDASTFNPMDTIELGDTYAEYIYYLDTASGYNGTDKYVAFAHGQTATFSSVYVDDIVINDIPACPKPVAVSLNNPTATTADISFSSSGASWPIEWGPAGFTQGTGGTDTATATTYTITGLPPATTLDFYIQNDCSPNNGVSVWSGPYTITTKCNTSSMPYTEGFGSWPPTCWNVSVGGVDVNHHSASGSAQFQYWNFNNVTMVMQSGIIDLSVDARVKFKWSHLYSTSYPNDAMTLRIRESGTSSWDTLWSKAGTDFNSNDGATNTAPGSFNAEVINLDTSWTNKDVEFEFFGNSGFGPNAYIDDFSVEAQPSCLESDSGMVSGILDTSATISWAAGGGAGWKIEYGPAGFTQGTGMQITTTTTSQNLSGLTSNTCYDVYIQDSCGVGSFSNWYGPLTFCTACATQTAPWTDDLDGSSWVADDANFSAANSIIDPCWTRNPDNGTAYSWRVRSTSTGSGATGPNSDHSGTGNYAYVEASSSGTSAELLTPNVDVSGLTQPQLTFWFHFYGTQINRMYVDVYDGSTWTTVDSIVGQHQSSSNDPWLKRDILLNNTGVIQVRFRAIGAGCCSGDAAIDDVSIVEAPACPDPQQIAAALIQGFSADIIWNGPNNSQQYYVEYGLQGFSQGTGGGTLDSTSTNSFTVAGLTPVTCYDIYVQTDCGVDGMSQWVGPFNFCTTVSCPIPSGVQLNTVSTTDAWLSWTSGGAGNWDYIIGTNPTTPASGTIITATSDSINVTGLSPATTYDFWVRDSCGAGDVSTWVGPFTFSTLCTTFSLNYLEDFQSWAAGSALPCWDELKYNTMPVDRYTSGSDVMAEFRFWSYNSPNKTAFTSPAINVTAKSRLRFKWSHLYSTSYPDDEVIVMAKTTGATTWDTLATYMGTTFTVPGAANTSPASTFQEDTITLDSNYIGNDIQVRFVGISDWGPNYYLNDVVVEVDPSFSTCPNPSNLAVSNISTSGAVVAWTAGGSGLSWQLSYGVGTNATSGTKLVTTTNPHVLSGLSSSSTYSVYVREICSAGDTSVWLGPLTFNTPCVASAMPYALGFASWPPVCVDLTGGSFNWDHYNSTAARANFWNISSGEAWMTTNQIDVNGAAQLRYEWSRGSSTFYNDSLYILSRVVGATNWDTIKAVGGSTLESNDGATNTTPGTYVMDTIPLPIAYIGDTIEVAFVGVTDFGPDLFVKSAIIEALSLPGCPAPSNTSATFGCDSATISWTSDTASLFTIVRWDTAGFNPVDTSQGTTIVLATSPIQLTGLMPGTSYDVWIVDSCTSGTSATLVSFTTDSAPLPSIAYTATQGTTTLTTADVALDASATTDGGTYTWDFGGGNTASGDTANYTYSTNGTHSVTLTVTNGCGVADTTFNVDVQGIGIEESLLSRSLKVYPNPTSGQFRVTFQISGIQEIEVRVLNAAGQIVQSENVGNVSGTFNAEYDLSNEAKGIYILQVKTAQGVISKRVSVQ